MSKAKTNYKKKCKSRKVDFYLHEQDLYNFSKSINFQAFIKMQLKMEMQREIESGKYSIFNNEHGIIRKDK